MRKLVLAFGAAALLGLGTASAADEPKLVSKGEGHWVLMFKQPILAGDQIIGTVDPKFDRASKTLVVNRVVLEPGRTFDDDARRAVADLAQFLACGAAAGLDGGGGALRGHPVASSSSPVASGSCSGMA